MYFTSKLKDRNSKYGSLHVLSQFSLKFSFLFKYSHKNIFLLKINFFFAVLKFKTTTKKIILKCKEKVLCKSIFILKSFAKLLFGHFKHDEISSIYFF